jgi:hypothetical protein
MVLDAKGEMTKYQKSSFIILISVQINKVLSDFLGVS